MQALVALLFHGPTAQLAIARQPTLLHTGLGVPHHITPLACCNHGRPACHAGWNRRLSFLAGGGCSRGRGVHALHTTSTRKATCTAHVVSTRCLHVLHASMSEQGG